LYLPLLGRVHKTIGTPSGWHCSLGEISSSRGERRAPLSRNLPQETPPGTQLPRRYAQSYERESRPHPANLRSARGRAQAITAHLLITLRARSASHGHFCASPRYHGPSSSPIVRPPASRRSFLVATLQPRDLAAVTSHLDKYGSASRGSSRALAHVQIRPGLTNMVLAKLAKHSSTAHRVTCNGCDSIGCLVNHPFATLPTGRTTGRPALCTSPAQDRLGRPLPRTVPPTSVAGEHSPWQGEPPPGRLAEQSLARKATTSSAGRRVPGKERHHQVGWLKVHPQDASTLGSSAT